MPLSAEWWTVAVRSDMQLAHPAFLLLGLPIALFVWLAQRRSLVGMDPPQRRATLALRSLLLLCLLLALSGLRWRRESDALGVLFLVDASASISPEAAAQARRFVAESVKARGGSDAIGVLGFASHTRVWQPPAESSQLSTSWPETPDADRNATDLGRALDFASAVFPAQSFKRAVLLTDGNDTSGHAEAAAARLAAGGAQLFTIPLRNPDRPEVLVGLVQAPRSVRNGQPFDLRANIESNLATSSRVNLYQDNLLLGGREVALQPGRNEVVFANLAVGGGFSTFEVEVVAEQDTLLENNRARVSVTSAGEPRVLLVDADEARALPLANALRAAKIAVETRGLSGLPRTLEDLQRFDLFLLSDVSALNLNREQMELYRTWVQDFGGGFVMIGGDNSFGVGGYYRTPVEQMLPVRMEHDDRQDTPTVALLVTLDRSGSMSAPVQGQTKIALADQGAALALGVLQPKDQFGLTAVDTKINLIVPLGRVTSRAAVEQKILGITAGGGGIYIYTALADAFQRMRDVNAKIKHVILFSDAADAEEKFAGEMADGAKTGGSAIDLVGQMLQAKITTSVVALGFERDKDVNFLRLLADRGNGRFYLTNDALNLPQIFTTETMKVAQSSLVEEPFLAKPVGRSPILAGLNWAQAPLLLGYNSTKLKPTADLLLATEIGEPLLATWRYGLGQSAAFTSDAKARWSGGWMGWAGYGKFWTQLVRGLMRPGDAANFQVHLVEGDGTVTLEMEAARADGSFRNDLAISATATAPDGISLSRPAKAVAPGRYVAEFPRPTADGTTLFAISAPGFLERPHVLGFTKPFPREFLKTSTDEEALRTLARIGNGKYDPKPEDIFVRPATKTSQWMDLSGPLLAAALLLLPLDIYLRRREWKRAET